VAPGEVTLGALQLLTDRTMTAAPDRFAPSGALFGVTSGDLCQVFRPEGGLFMGEYPSAACAVWPAAVRKGGASLRELQPRYEVQAAGTPDTRVPAPVGGREAVWHANSLTVWAGGKPVSRYLGMCGKPCGAIAAVAWSPDGERLAIAHSGDSRLVFLSARDGVLERELPLAAGFAVVPGLLAWSPSSIVAVTGPLQRDEQTAEFGSEEWTLHRKTTPPLRLYVWPNQGRPANLPLDDLDSASNALSLDPAGRFLFNSGSGPHDSMTVEGYDLRSGIERAFYYRSAADPVQAAVRNETASGVWLPGRYPLWETVEAHIPEEGAPTYTVWRLYTRPDLDGPRLERIDLPSPPPAHCESRRVLPDGRTVMPAESSETYDSCGRNAMDPTGRLRGVGRDKLQRVEDGLQLQVGARGCLSTDSGFYSCLDVAAERRYVVGSDPLRALLLHGDQLAPLLLRPQLLTEYLQGDTLAAPSKDTLLGVPPRLHLEVVRPSPEVSTKAQIVVDITDEGSGIGPLRLYRDGLPIGLPISVHSGRQEVDLPQLDRSCRELRAYACNATGYLCSPAVTIAPCKATVAGDDRDE
jgi:hypothetical protein